MDIREKLNRLRAIDDVALVRWTGGDRVCGGMFIPATELHMNVLVCDKGRVFFSSAGSVMMTVNGRCQLRYFDDDVYRVVSGPRKNVNILKSFLKDGEEIMPLIHCMHTEVTDKCSKFVEKAVLSMGQSMWYPVWGLPIPDLYRMTTHPESLRPIYTKQLLASIGGGPEDTSRQLLAKFLANIDRLGSRTAEGWVIRDEFIASGGMCVCASEGITKAHGSRVMVMPLKLLKLETRARNWNLHLGDNDDVEGIFAKHIRDTKNRVDDAGDNRARSSQGR